ALPALLGFFVQICVPESRRWEEERRRGTTSHWAGRDLVGVIIGALGACGIVYLWAMPEPGLVWRLAGTIACFVVTLTGFLYPVMRYLIRAETSDLATEHRRGPTVRRMLLGSALSGVALIGTWGSVQWAPTWAAKLAEDHERAKVREKLEKQRQPGVPLI